MRAVLTHRRGSGYDDVPEERYHFPATYLRQAKAAEGDFVVYYEPRRGPEGMGPNPGRQAYFATARIEHIENDPRQGDHYYAIIADYIDFDQDVPFQADGTFFESALRKDDGSTNKGQFGRSVRAIPDNEFDQIVSLGFACTLRDEDLTTLSGFEEEQAPFNRPTVEVTTNRLFRDKAFGRNIQATYRKTCAFTGLQIINGGGRSEAQAAHIRPVAQHGSDSIRNGLALSSTIHWMFDRGLLSIDDDYRILTAGNAVPDPVRRLLNPTGLVTVPESEIHRPHPRFLRFHRDNIFKG